MMNKRTMNPAAGTARISVNQYPIARLRYIKYHITMKGINELSTCQTLRHVSGYAYFATTACHLNFSVFINLPPLGTSSHCTLLSSVIKGNSDKDGVIKFAPLIASSAVTGFGTATTKIPARFAASTPSGESSNTTASSFWT